MRVLNNLFGQSREATMFETIVLKEAALNLPTTLFQELNKMINKQGFCLRIEKLSDSDKQVD